MLILRKTRSMKKVVFFSLGILLFSTFLFAQVQIGGDVNYAEIEQDGTLEFHGDATVFDDLVIPLISGKSATNPPTFTLFMNNGSTSEGVYAYLFENVASNSENQVFFTIQMPHAWKTGSEIYPHIHWAPEDNGTGAVVWGMEYTWVEYNASTTQQFPQTTIVTGTSTSFSNSAHKHLITPFGAITPSSNQDDISSVLVVRLFRNSSNAADTYTGGAFGLSFDLHYERDTDGSRTEWVK